MNSESLAESAAPCVAPDAGRAPLPAQRGIFSIARQKFARMSTTRANGQIGLVADVAISIVLVGAGLWRGDVRLVTAVFIVLLGLFAFSFIEYCFHRWLFHGPSQVVEQGHRKHHEQPQGHDALPFFVPPLTAVVLAYLLSFIMPVTSSLLLMGAMAAGYAAYGLSHTAIHNLRFRYPLSRRWAAIHHIHHYHPDKNFGVTTPLWDILLGTRYVSNARGPQRHETAAGIDS
jgi:sterol desaturase/sphingolipid hydroxylase (fatty acid hydroxylase superfamily)